MIISTPPNKEFKLLVVRVDDLSTLHMALRMFKAITSILYQGNVETPRTNRLLEEVESTIENYLRGGEYED